ncbi:homoserine kinase [Dokdonia pacifica]|uniref:Homoserine kinase n=1 Tax=Dokdonia pacifica TaxID=1627892 RepID=A0A239AZ63_9FLAO|nr:homoserine kinase [Dokdonia pacifica]GGG32452.1 homoserine kinase [Dokdonia pacifica]SNS00661.1 homoserine kinase [Dokdonia pacifica]
MGRKEQEKDLRLRGDEIKIFCPATVANVNCGFDTLGFALEGIGDKMVFRKVSTPGVTITVITGEELPMEAHNNVAGVAGNAMLQGIQADFGVEIEIHKNIRSGSGIGSSAASAAGAVFGINQLLDHPISNLELTRYAMKGEALASGNEHADNVAPCIYGGTTLITGYDPLRVISLPPMETVYVGILHPHIKIATKDARAILPKEVPLKDAITQAQRLAGFVASLYEWDKQLFIESVQDVLVEPHRKQLIPHFDTIKTLSKEHGCMAFGISGSGPSLFAFAFAKANIESYLMASKAYYKQQHLKVDTYSSQISGTGCQVIQ